MLPSSSITQNLLCSAKFGVPDALAILGIIVLLAFSAFFSSAETAFSRANLIRMKNSL